MCLTDLEKFTPAKKGWQIKRRAPGHKNTYMSLWHGTEMYELGKTYEANSFVVNTTPRSYFRKDKPYICGFHVFHSFVDAEKYLKKCGGPPNEYCIVEVETGGSKTTGWQDFEHLVRDHDGSLKLGTCKAKVTVCGKITLLKEISYGYSH